MKFKYIAASSFFSFISAATVSITREIYIGNIDAEFQDKYSSLVHFIPFESIGCLNGKCNQNR
jgi:hypothetical protein